MYQSVDPLLAEDAEWFTVGDGRFGKDARYVASHGRHVVATDISDTLLREAKARGFIAEYQQENAERLSFADGSFDYCLCKESYHHFPRPMVALYEMLRVVRRGVVLIEPNDAFVGGGLKSWVRAIATRALGKAKHDYEESGNYVFRISRRELEKVALGMNWKAVAFRGINDAFLPGVELEQMSQNGPMQRRIRMLVALKNLACRLGLADYQLLTAVVFKQRLAPELVRSLERAGFEVREYADNPYL
jgi:SAM-dependent methyltransferase